MTKRSSPDTRSLVAFLVHESRNARLARDARRLRGFAASAGDDQQAQGDRFALMAGMLDAALAEELPPIADLGALIDRVATRHQMASRGIHTLVSKVRPLKMPGWRARGYAVVVSEILAYLDAVVPPHGTLGVYLALRRSEGAFLIAIAVVGAFRPVAGAGATRGLLRAIEISEALGATFQRGATSQRMVFGVTLANYRGRERSTRPRAPVPTR